MPTAERPDLRPAQPAAAPNGTGRNGAEPDDPAQSAAWRAQMARMGWRHTTAVTPGPTEAPVSERVRHAMAYEAAVETLRPEFERRAVLSGSALRAAAARGLIAAGMRDTEEVSVLTRMMATTGVRQDGKVTHLEWRGTGEDGAKVTTALHREQEAELMALARKGVADRSGALTVEEMRAAVDRLGVRYQGQTGQEQIDAVIGVNGSVLTVREVRRDGLRLETAAGKVGFVPWAAMRERGGAAGARVPLAYGD